MEELEKKVAELEKKLQELTEKNSNSEKKSTAIVVFSGDMDRAIAALNIAVCNLSLGKEVHLFFTFWGSILMKKGGAPKAQKHFLQRMFTWMMPSDPSKLPLSKMNYFGLGPFFMKYLMKKYQFYDVEDLLNTAKALGVKLYMCSMSMELMGIKKEELITEPKLIYTGVAGFMEIAERSSITLFI